jgi:4-aminobutyrate aminotransferase
LPAGPQVRVSRPHHPTLTCGPAGNVVRLIPALVVTAEEITLGLERFETAVGAVTAIPATTGA